MKIESKFNIGDTIYFMDGTKPVKENIAGITTFTGKSIDYRGYSKETVEDKVIVEYHIMSGAVKVWEENVYGTKEELIKATFDSL